MVRKRTSLLENTRVRFPTPAQRLLLAHLSRTTPQILCRVQRYAGPETEAARLLQLQSIAIILEQVLGLAARIIAGGVIITVGMLSAGVLANIIDRSTNGADGFASTLVCWAAIALATAMGLRFMGIADEIVIRLLE